MKQLHVRILLVLLFVGTANLVFSSERKTYRLEYNLKKNQSYKQRMHMAMEISQEVMGQKIDITTDTRMETTYLVKKVSKDLITLDFMYDNIRSITKTDAGGMKMEIDSDTPRQDSVSSPLDLGAIYKAITGIPVSVNMTKKGKVQSVSGTDKWSEAILSTIDSHNQSAQAEQLTSQIARQFNETAIKQQIEQVSTYFPEKDVAIGDTWKTMMEVRNPYVVTSNMDMKLLEVDGNIATIEGNGVIFTPEEVITEEQGIQVRMNLTGTQSSIIKLDLKTGWPVDGKVVIEMEGEGEAMGVKIPVTARTTMHLTR